MWFSDEPQYRVFAKGDHRSLVIVFYKNTSFKGSELEILYKVSCYNTKKNVTREFYIQKTDRRLREKTLSNYTIVEQTNKGNFFIYPFGWQTQKIEIKEMRDNCISIIENNIQPI